MKVLIYDLEKKKKCLFRGIGFSQDIFHEKIKELKQSINKFIIFDEFLSTTKNLLVAI